MPCGITPVDLASVSPLGTIAAIAMLEIKPGTPMPGTFRVLVTGGEIFVAAEALHSLRVPCSPPEPVSGAVHSALARRGRQTITASWSDV
jgi:hypothetical protein